MMILVNTLNTTESDCPPVGTFGGVALLWDFHYKASVPVIRDLFLLPYVLEQDEEPLVASLLCHHSQGFCYSSVI